MEALHLVLVVAAVSATPPGSANGATAQSRNFTVSVSAGSPSFAEEVLRRAESLRREIALDWLGEELPADARWTDIQIRITEAEDCGMTWLAESGRVDHHVMRLRTSADQAAGRPTEGSMLAHELTHIVLATRFPGRLPAWAHEGASMLRDDPPRAKMREQTIDWFFRTSKWPSLEILLGQAAISPTDWLSFAASASLTQYLLTLGTKTEFLNFAISGKTDGWNSALRNHYGIDNTARLQASWQRWATERNRDRLREMAEGSRLLAKPLAIVPVQMRR